MATILRGARGARATALKFTTTEDVFERCPRGTPCVVCDIERPFRIVSEPAVLLEPGTDTERLSVAGASRVLWAIARKSAVAAAWRALVAMLEPGFLVLEGSTIARTARPDLLLYVVHPFLEPARWKAGAAGLLREADAVVVNLAARETRPPSAAVLRAIEAARGDGARVADVTAPLHDWAPDLAARVGALAAAAAPAR
jgi:hypothetical protein